MWTPSRQASIRTITERALHPRAYLEIQLSVTMSFACSGRDRRKVLRQQHAPAVEFNAVTGEENKHFVLLVGAVQEIADRCAHPRGRQLQCSRFT